MRTSIFLLLSTALFWTQPAAAGDQKTLAPIQGEQLRGIRASHTFSITLHRSDDASRNGVSLTIDERLEPYLKASVSGGILRLGFEELPKELQNTANWSCPATADVTLSRLDRIDLSGMASVRTSDTFSGTAPQIDLSGMSRVEALTISVVGGGKPDIDVSGMSRIDLTLRNPMSGVEVDASGMSHVRLTLDGKVDATKIDISGKSRVDLSVSETAAMEIEASGLSTVSASGKADRLEAEVSGNSNLDLGNLTVAEADCEATGMSSIVCRVTQGIDASASGKSSIRVHADRTIRMKTEASTMSKITFE
ncbi:MAG: DUF2807 domain-containing protein [Rikenella sp.]|nr:DUF2807 domain-containing protein [Rikenella sp.]